MQVKKLLLKVFTYSFTHDLNLTVRVPPLEEAC